MQTYQGDTDKIVLETGQKEVSNLAGEKYGGSLYLLGDTDKDISLSGQKNISNLSGLKDISSLSGLKYISDLNGLKHISNLLGLADKNPVLYGEAGEGYWKIYVDTTYITVDSTTVKSDRD